MNIDVGVNFFKNAKVDYKEIKDKVYHPYINLKYPKRFLFVKLKSYINNFIKQTLVEPRIIGITGIRGVGKTLLMWQLIDYIYNNDKNIDIYYLSLDIAYNYNLTSSILIESFDKIKGKNRVVLFLDEAQYLKNWDLIVKILYDKYKDIFIIVSGSSSLSLNYNVDLASRWTLQSLYPLSFPEFVLIRNFYKKGEYIFPKKGLSEKLKEIIFYSDTTLELYDRLKKIEPDISSYLTTIKQKSSFFKNILEQYVFYHNIPRILLNDEKKSILDSILEMLKRIVNEDIVDFYNIEDKDEVNKILYYIPFTDDFNQEKISNFLGIKLKKINRIIDILINSEILVKFPFYSGVKNRINQYEKLFFISPTIRYAIIRKVFENNKEKFHPKLYEDIVALYLKKNVGDLTFYTKDKEKKTPDFIVRTNSKPIAIEIGSSKKTLSQLRSKEFRYGILLNSKGNKIEKKDNVLILPLIYFLLI